MLLLNSRERKRKSFLKKCGWQNQPFVPLKSDASKRTYYRLGTPDSGSCILMDCPPDFESVKPFKKVDSILINLGYSAPEVLAEDEKNGFLLLEDFGDATFTKCIQSGTDTLLLYETAIDVLIDLHKKPLTFFINDVPVYSIKKFLAESALLTEWYYPKIMGHPIKEDAFMEWEKIWADTLNLFTSEAFLVLRDYHVDNLVWLSHRQGVQRCGLLDFQDAVAGPRAYDVVSLLEDARLDVPAHIRETMLQRYFDAFPKLDRDRFLAEYNILGAQRNAKIIGIFSRLAFRDSKSVYLSHIPRVWKLLENNLLHPALKEVREWLDYYIVQKYRKVPT